MMPESLQTKVHATMHEFFANCQLSPANAANICN